MKKVAKGFLLICLMFIVALPVFSACNNKEKVELKVFGQTSLNVKRDGRVNFLTYVNGAESIEPEIIIVHDTSSTQAGKPLSASMVDSILLISKDAVIGSKIQVQAFYKNSTIKSNILEFTVVNTDVENIYFEGQGVTFDETKNQYNLSLAPKTEIELKDYLRISPDFATDNDGLITKNKIAFDVSQMKGTDKFYEYISDSNNKTIKILSEATAGSALQVDAVYKDKKSRLVISVATIDSSVNFTNRNFDVICGRSFDLKSPTYLNLVLGNGSNAVGKTFEDLTYKITAGAENASINNGELTLNHYKNISDIGKTITVEVSGDKDSGGFITDKTVATFTIKENKLASITTLYNSDNPIGLKYAEIHDMKQYFTLVGDDSKGDVTDYSIESLIFNTVNINESIAKIINNKLGIMAYGAFSQDKYKITAKTSDATTAPSADLYFKVVQDETLTEIFNIVGETVDATSNAYNLISKNKYTINFELKKGSIVVDKALYLNDIEFYEGITLVTKGINFDPITNVLSFDNNIVNGKYSFKVKPKEPKSKASFIIAVDARTGLFVTTDIPYVNGKATIDTTANKADYKFTFNLYENGEKKDLSNVEFNLYKAGTFKAGTKEAATIIKLKHNIYGQAGFGEILPIRHGTENIEAVIKIGEKDYISNVIDLEVILVANVIDITAEGGTLNNNHEYIQDITFTKTLTIGMGHTTATKGLYNEEYMITVSFNGGAEQLIQDLTNTLNFAEYGTYKVTVSTLRDDVATKTTKSITITVTKPKVVTEPIIDSAVVNNYSDFKTALESASIKNITISAPFIVSPTATIVVTTDKIINGANYTLTNSVASGAAFDFIQIASTVVVSISNLTVVGNDDLASNSGNGTNASSVVSFIENKGLLTLSKVNISKYEIGIKNSNQLTITDVVISDIYDSGIYNTGVITANTGNQISACGLACIKFESATQSDSIKNIVMINLYANNPPRLNAADVTNEGYGEMNFAIIVTGEGVPYVGANLVANVINSTTSAIIAKVYSN